MLHLMDTRTEYDTTTNNNTNVIMMTYSIIYL